MQNNAAKDESDHHPDQLAAAASSEGERPARSRLEPCAQAIFILRDKRWSFATITAWLGQRGVEVAESTVQRFYRSRRKAHMARQSGPATISRQPESFFDASHENLQSPIDGTRVQPPSKPKYNTDF